MIVVRHAREGDASGILACLQAAFEPYRREYSEAGFHDTVLDADTLRARMAQMPVFVAARDGAIVGTIAANVLEDREGHIRGMAVAPSCQREGVGRRLLRRALDDLTAGGCKRATLDTTEPLTRAARFYESAGFSRTGNDGDFFGMPLHEYATALDTSFTIRESRLDDAPAITDVVNAAYVVERFFLEGDRINENEVRGCIGRGTFLVASTGGAPPSACVFLQQTGNGRTYLGLLAVDPREQKRRLGALVMAAAERYCRRRGDVAIDIRVVSLRTELPPFYEARGFVSCGTAPFEDPRLFKPAHFNLMSLALQACLP
jgi:GNAT superfamily N-acetyltransferase